MKKLQTPAEQEVAYKALAVIFFCFIVLATFFIIGSFTYLYVIIIGLVASIFVYER